MKESNLKRSGKRAARIEEEEKNSSIFSDLIYSFCNGSRRNSLDTNRKKKKQLVRFYFFITSLYYFVWVFCWGELWLAICRVILFEMTSMHYPECRRTCSKGIGMLLCVHLLGNLTAGCSVVYRLEHEIPAHFFLPLGIQLSYTDTVDDGICVLLYFYVCLFLLLFACVNASRRW